MLFKVKKEVFIPFVVLIQCIIFTSCTNIDKKECSKTHWPTQGFEDGKEGRNSRTSMFLAKCSPFNVQFDTDGYLEGYEKGLDKFCSDDSAFSRGFQGLSPEGVCKGKKNYIQNYQSGVQSLCTFDLGEKESLAGKSYNSFCPTKTKYKEGYDKGIKLFCSYDNGFKFGIAGSTFSDICKGDFQKTYIQGYNKGRLEYLKKDTSIVQDLIQEKEKTLLQTKDTYTEKLAEAYDLPKQSEDPEIQSKISTLDKEIVSLKEALSKIEEHIFELQKKINANNLEISKLNTN